jgi:hypothetical protein
MRDIAAWAAKASGGEEKSEKTRNAKKTRR